METEVRTTEPVALEPGAFESEIAAENLESHNSPCADQAAELNSTSWEPWTYYVY